MIATHISARDRKTLLIGICTIATLILVTRGIPAFIRWQKGFRDATMLIADEAVQSQSEAHNALLIDRVAGQIRRRYFALAPAFLEGDGPTVAGASLISMVNEAASDAGLQLGALQVETDSLSNRAATIVSVRGDGNADVAGVTHFLSVIEGGVPLLSFHELTITAADARGSDGAPESLHIGFVIQGLQRHDVDASNAGDRK